MTFNNEQKKTYQYFVMNLTIAVMKQLKRNWVKNASIKS